MKAIHYFDELNRASQQGCSLMEDFETILQREQRAYPYWPLSNLLIRAGMEIEERANNRAITLG